jgi:hypothetical protein
MWRLVRPALAAGAAVAGVSLSVAPSDDIDAVPRKRLRLPAVGFSAAVACEASGIHQAAWIWAETALF